MARKKHYNIFISYRRQGGAQYARVLSLMLERAGYSVFLDYDELTDGVFRPEIENAIREADVFLLVLSPGALDRCTDPGDWVRREIELALADHKQIVPVNPDGLFTDIPATVPAPLREAISSHQYSEVSFGQNLRPTARALIENRIRPYTRRRRPLWPWLTLGILLVLTGSFLAWRQCTAQRQAEAVRIQQAQLDSLKRAPVPGALPAEWAPEITRDQLVAIRSLLEGLQPVKGGTFMQGAPRNAAGAYDPDVYEPDETPAFSVAVADFMLGKYEVTVGQWNAIMGQKRPGDPALPVADVTYTEVQEFLERLYDLSLLELRLPTESEWEYAARSGSEPEGFRYPGGDDPRQVAWYADNSRGQAHRADSYREPTVGDLFHMAGNVAEWTSTDFAPYQGENPFAGQSLKVVRGGSYASGADQLPVYHRDTMAPTDKSPTLGFRIAL